MTINSIPNFIIRNQRNIIESDDGTVWRDGTIFDITDIKNAQEEVEKNELFLNTLLDSQEQIIITTNGETITSANETFLDFFAVDNIDEFT